MKFYCPSGSEHYLPDRATFGATFSANLAALTFMTAEVPMDVISWMIRTEPQLNVRMSESYPANPDKEILQLKRGSR